MKRLLIAAMIVSAIGAVGAAQAGCPADGRGGSAGPYETAGVTYENIEVYAWTYGNFATGPASVCSDGSVDTSTSAYGDFYIKIGGDIVCTSSDTSQRSMTADPFGFGSSISSAGDNCAVAISFDGISGTPGVSADDVNTEGENINAGWRKAAAVKNFGEGSTDPSTITVNGVVTEIPNGTIGFFSKGVGAQSESSG